MAIDKNTKSMLNPYGSGENFGIGVDDTLAGVNHLPTNYNEAMSSNQRTSVIDMLVSKVTSTGSSGQENFLLSNGGNNLGTAYDGKVGKTYGNGK